VRYEPNVSWYRRILGVPFVYERVRPLVLGGIDTSPVYQLLQAGPEDTVLDVGCGTGVALRHLEGFSRYVGFDTDPIAVRHAREREGQRPEVTFFDRALTEDDVREWVPDLAVLSGLFHHLSDEDAIGLLRVLATSSRLRRVTTLDVSFFPHQLLNNLLTVLDRGQYPRRPEGYAHLAEAAGYEVEHGARYPSRRGGSPIGYWVMSLRPPALAHGRSPVDGLAAAPS